MNIRPIQMPTRIILASLYDILLLFYYINQLEFVKLINRFRLFVFHETKGSRTTHLTSSRSPFYPPDVIRTYPFFYYVCLQRYELHTLTPIQCSNVICVKMIRDHAHTRTKYPRIFSETWRLRPQQQPDWNVAHNLSSHLVVSFSGKTRTWEREWKSMSNEKKKKWKEK